MSSSTNGASQPSSAKTLFPDMPAGTKCYSNKCLGCLVDLEKLDKLHRIVCKVCPVCSEPRHSYHPRTDKYFPRRASDYSNSGTTLFDTPYPGSASSPNAAQQGASSNTSSKSLFGDFFSRFPSAEQPAPSTTPGFSFGNAQPLNHPFRGFNATSKPFGSLFDRAGADTFKPSTADAGSPFGHSSTGAPQSSTGNPSRNTSSGASQPSAPHPKPMLSKETSQSQKPPVTLFSSPLPQNAANSAHTSIDTISLDGESLLETYPNSTPTPKSRKYAYTSSATPTENQTPRLPSASFFNSQEGRSTAKRKKEAPKAAKRTKRAKTKQASVEGVKDEEFGGIPKA